jgi:hypothetical protein
MKGPTGPEEDSMSGAMAQVPDDHPLMIAWTKYKQQEDYANSFKWATAGISPPTQFDLPPGANPLNADFYRRAVEGALWSAFLNGFAAAGGNVHV